MVLIKFTTEPDEVKGFYLLATEAHLRGLRSGLYEVPDYALIMLQKHGVGYTQLNPSEFALDEAQTIRNTPAVEL